MAPDLVAYDAAYPPMDLILASPSVLQAAYAYGAHAYITAQIQQFMAAGKGILPNHELAADALLGGYPAGRQAALYAVPNVIGWGCPANGTAAICYSVDVELNPGQYAAVGAAFDGINTVHAGRFRSSCYGQGGLIDYLAQNGKTTAKGWLSSSASFPGYDQSSPNVGMYQLVGTDIPGTDKSIITDPAGLCAWWPAGVTPSGGGQPIPIPDPPPPEEPVTKDLIFKVGDGPAAGQFWILLTSGRYVPIENPTEMAVWEDSRLADTVIVAKGDVNGASITGATHASLVKQAGA